jgi:uncharacterized protein
LRRWLKRLVLTLVAGLVLLFFGLFPWLLAGLFTTRRFEMTDKENAGLTPASFELKFEEAAFPSRDGVALQGWWVPAEDAHGTVVLVHGLNRSRIEMIRKLPFLHKAGWNALLFDLRRHGASGGEVRSLGWGERLDVLAAADYARKRSALPVVAWGISFGGAAAVLAAAEDPQIAGVVCDSSYRSLPDTVAHHMQLFRGFRWWLRIVPTWPVGDEVLFWIGRRGGFDPDTVDILAAAKHLSGRPCLFVCNSDDPRMPADIARDLKAAVGDSAQLLVVPGNSHGGAYKNGTAAYETAVKGILGEVLGEGGRSRP